MGDSDRTKKSAERREWAIRRLVECSPPLTDEQRAILRELFVPVPEELAAPPLAPRPGAVSAD